MRDRVGETATPVAVAGEPSTRPQLAGDELAGVIADTVLATPGVVRLEPTLSAVGLRGLYRNRRADGIQLVTRSGVVEVDINVATNRSHQARAVAEAIRAAVIDLLGSMGLVQGVTTVNVLTIEADSATS